MKKIIKIGISVIIISLMFSFLSCGKNSSEVKEADRIERLEKKEEVIVGVGQSMLEKGFDPCKGWGNYGVTLIQSKLLDFDFENNIIKDLAENYEVSEDGKIWIFKIREDVKFSDGQKLTAKDVAFTFNKTKEIGTTFDFKLLEKAEALDDKTVKFTFSAPCSTFIYNAANLGIVAEHAYKDSNSYSLSPIGSGPYKLVSYTQGQQLILDRNEEYYGTKPKFKRLTLVTMTPDTALASIKAGDIDIVNVSEAMAQEKITNYSILATKTMDFRAISMPTIKSGGVNEKGNPMGNNVTSDIAIRKAINYGVDRQEIIENVLYGYGEVIFDFFDSLPWGIKDEIRKEFKNGDIEKANEILNKAGWEMKDGGIREKDGIKAEFRLLYPASDDTRQSCAEAFAVQCKKIGINVIPEGSDWTEMEKRQSSDACVIGGGQYTPEVVARFYFSERIGGPWSNIVRENNPIVDEHIRAAYLATDEKVAIENWQKALWDGKEGGSVLGDAPYCTICYLEHLYFVRDGLDLGRQKLHTHARDLSLMANIEEWDFKK
ncbi:ABC transporter substrate-binding protein [Fusobacterium simiae]|uniref:ABC transporter substrate-binding protein n=1 Tax=Fusobacterium simiae TaxID=855 RepID=A0ABT4DFX7_FUSSI|nr:ABC transporter substrate-binding protein [Fusobacterium simiae]MCY7007497.1 ABC transporter substrate-binding protein [Fusobacterium simiae]